MQDKIKGQRIELVEMRQQIAELQKVETQRKQAEEALELKVEQLAALSQASQVVTASLELDAVLAEIVSLAREVMTTDYTSVVLVDAAGNIGRSAENLPGVPGIEYRIRDEGLTRWIVHSRQGVIIDEIGEDGVMIPDLGEGAPRFANPPIVKAGVKSVAGLPLMVKDRLLGVLYLHSLHTGAFHGQLPLLTTFANQMAIAIDNARLYEALKQELAERKRVEEALWESEERFQRIAKATNDVMWDLDLVTNAVWWNEGLKTLFGYGANEVGHDPTWWREHIHPEDRERVVSGIYTVINGGERFWSDEYRYQRADGSYAHVFDRGYVLRDDSGKPLRMIGGIVDITERKRAEEELRLAHRKLRVTFDAIQESMTVVDLDFNITDANDVLIKTFGLPAKESILGRKCFELLKGRKDICPYCAVAEAYRTKAPVYRTTTPEEEVLTRGRSFEVFTYPVMDEHGNPIWAVEFGRDITERKRAAEALRESEERFRELVENANDIIYTHDPDGNFTSANPAATRIYGYTHEEILQLNIAQIVAPEYLPLARQKIQEKLEGSARTGPYELLTYTKEGKPIWVEVSTRLLEREDQPIGVLGIARDITERKRAEEELEESEERFRLAFEDGPIGMTIVGLDYKLLQVNKVFCEMLGYTEQELTALTFVDITHPEDVEKDVQLAEKVFKGEIEAYELEKRYIKKNQEILWSDLTATVIRDHDGKSLYGLAMIEDITDRKRAEEELRQSYVQLQRTLEGTVHALVSAIEMRDPYTAGHQRRVTQLACAIAKEMDLDGEQIEGIRMAGLIHDIGKINVPAEILSKPSPLTELEYGLIKMHPQVGHDVLKTMEFPWPVAQIVLQHHERMDGSGYPQALSGDEIILEARILSVADVVEAMASHRPYRAPRGIDKALQEISQNRGILYDPEVVDACLTLFAEKRFKFE
jgi:PAS domain S-box-containing protein